MPDEYLWDLPQFDHTPVNPPREGVVAEEVFTRQWAELVKDDGNIMNPFNYRFASILPHLSATPRAAKVAASFVRWLGTSIGRAFVEQAEYFVRRNLSKEEAFILAWTMENLRSTSVNNGVRTLEWILTPTEKYEATRRAAPVSVEDLEVAENMARWLGSADGQQFLKSCQEELRQIEDDDRVRRLNELGVRFATTAPSLVACTS